MTLELSKISGQIDEMGQVLGERARRQRKILPAALELLRQFAHEEELLRLVAESQAGQRLRCASPGGEPLKCSCLSNPHLLLPL